MGSDQVVAALQIIAGRLEEISVKLEKVSAALEAVSYESPEGYSFVRTIGEIQVEVH